MKGKKNSKRYLAGYIDLGILGRREAFLFRNEKREKDNQPAFRLMIKDGDGWKEVGAFWVRELKEKPREVEYDVTDI